MNTTLPDHNVPTGDTDTAATDGEGTAAAEVGQLAEFPVESLAPHPDNPRGHLGDLTELARSIKAQGVLQPLLVLPAGEGDGRHLIVAGHRRHAAAVQAKATTVPAIVRDLTPAEVIEAFLVENGQRSDLTVSEEVRAIERLVDLSGGKLTVARLCKRIGRSQNWVRARMALCALPPQWRDAIDTGDLTLGAGEAAASVADLGPEHVDTLCQQFQGNSWGEHARLADAHRARVEREAAFDAEVAKARRRRGAVVLTSDDRPVGCLPVTEVVGEDEAKAHRGEPCHAVLIERTAYGRGFERTDVCRDPDRHAPDVDGVSPPGDSGPADDGDPGGEPDRSPVTGGAPTGAERHGEPDLDSSHLKRKGRLARLAFGKAVWARPRGGVSQAQATRFALRALVYEVSHDALRYAADILDVPEDQRGWGLPDTLVDAADSPAALARITAAVAAGAAECRMYHGYDGPTCRDWTALLTGAGWEPDPWTAAVLARQADRAEAAAAAADEGDGDGEGTAEVPAGDEGEATAEPTAGEEAGDADPADGPIDGAADDAPDAEHGDPTANGRSPGGEQSPVPDDGDGDARTEDSAA